LKPLYVLVFLSLGTRRTEYVACTTDTVRMLQQARNVLMAFIAGGACASKAARHRHRRRPRRDGDGPADDEEEQREPEQALVVVPKLRLAGPRTHWTNM
jgi:hypothetical protein